MNSKTELLYMGSPLSAVIANIYIEEFEEQAIAKATSNLRSGNDM